MQFDLIIKKAAPFRGVDPRLATFLPLRYLSLLDHSGWVDLAFWGLVAFQLAEESLRTREGVDLLHGKW